MIILKHISSAPLRLQRMLLKLQNFNVSITYRPGRDMIFADAFSRLLPINAPDTNTGSIRRYIHYTNVTPKTEHIIRIACETDNIDKDLRQLIAEGWPKDRRHLKTELRAYWPFRDELTIHNDLVHKGLATLIPEIAIPIILRKLHAAHVGECKMTLLARDKVFWPTIRQDLISYSNDCESCQIHERSNWKLPPNNREIPVSPWQYLAADLFQCNSTMYLLIVDYFTKFPVLFKLHSTTSEVIIRHMKSIFSLLGTPTRLYTDNGPQFSAPVFSQFVHKWDITHTTSSPHYPSSNGFIERHVLTIKNIIKRQTPMR